MKLNEYELHQLELAKAVVRQSDKRLSVYGKLNKRKAEKLIIQLNKKEEEKCVDFYRQ